MNPGTTKEPPAVSQAPSTPQGSSFPVGIANYDRVRPNGNLTTGSRPSVEGLDWLKKQALKDLQAAVTVHSKALGVTPGPVTVKDTTSRWGSCSSSGALAFSWRLILAPPFVLDYLAAHEVAHLVEMNHSARFWRVVGKVCGHVERAKTWLDTHGNDLHRYGIQEE